MRIALVYTTVTNGPRTDIYAARFAASYQQFPPGAEHETLIVCNGGPPAHSMGAIFALLPNCQFFPRSNEGWDIGGYLEAARGPAHDCDLMLCLGETVFFHRAGWLAKLVAAWEAYGPGMYGFFCSNVVRAHIQTTAFAVAPQHLRDYPAKVVNRSDRYEFEHGRGSLWRFLATRAVPTMLVTWDGVWAPNQWRQPPNILWRGDQSNCLMWCNHNERFSEASPRTKAIWQRWADLPFA